MLAAVAPDGTFAAFCNAAVHREDHMLLGRSEGWINQMGTHPAFRRQGLGRAIMVAALHRLKGHGVTSVLLETASANSAAQRPYASLGFETVYEMLLYETMPAT
jgi:mycothiol synthase